METIRENLYTELEAIQVDKSILGAMDELCYTADETGVLPFALNDEEDILTIVRLVRLAEKYRDNVPDKLCL